MAKLAEQEASKGEEVITVTGSLVGRKELTTAAPVSVVDREKLEAAGITNVGDILQKLPSQGNALNAQNNNGGDGSTRIDLRSLGTNRTLILMNGRRVVPSGLGADASVDLGTIPLAMVERVEVLKDGASAIYGSDAISGVVNIITRTDFNGTEATVYTATSQRGDGTNYDLSFVTGHSSKNGNLTFSAGYQDQKSVLAGDRKFSDHTAAFGFCNTEELAEDKMMPAEDQTCGKAPLSGSSSTKDGRLDTNNGGASGPGKLTVPGCTTRFCTSNEMGGFRNYIDPTETAFNDAYNFQTLNYLFTPSKRVNLFANGHYNITKNISTFFEAMYNDR
jgi:outer membrane receptor protein involved in Fe transport